MRSFTLKTIVYLCLYALLSSCSGGSSSTPAAATSNSNTYTVNANNAPSSFTINGTNNPTLTLQRNQTYTFTISETSNHPFYIMSVQGTNTANAFTSGVTGNGTTNGTLTFSVPVSAPNTLYYNCSIHAGMTGVINITN